MKVKIIFFAIILSCLLGFVSENTFVNCKFEFSKKEVIVGDEIELLIKGSIEKPWYVYSSKLEVDGPIPSSIRITKTLGLEKVDGLVPVNALEKHDDVWGEKVHYFKEDFFFKQKFKVLSKKYKLTGVFNYQTCNDELGKCIPGSITFSL
jgi:hypothetical protein